MMKRVLLPVMIACMLALTLPALAQPQPNPQQPENSLPQLVGIPLYEQARAALDQGDYSTAAVNFALLIYLNPTDSQSYFGRAISNLGLEETALALEDFSNAIRLAPPSATDYLTVLYTSRGRALAGAQEFDAALDDYASAIELMPEDPNLYADRARVFTQQENFEAALEDLNSAILLVNDDPFLMLYRAFVNTQLGDTVGAAMDYAAYASIIQTSVIEHDPLEPRTAQFIEMVEGQIDLFPFMGTRGDVISISAQARPGDTVDPLLILIGGDGRALAANDDGGGNLDSLIANFELPQTGVYLVVVTHALGGTTGSIAVGMEIES
jgi:tetratricopeptide (TPR) repeat protein